MTNAQRGPVPTETDSSHPFPPLYKQTKQCRYVGEDDTLKYINRKWWAPCHMELIHGFKNKCQEQINTEKNSQD